MKKWYAIFVFFAVCFLTGCEEEPTVTPYSYGQIFSGETKRGWTIRSIQFLEDGKGARPLGLADCVFDDIYVFHNNTERTFEIREGSTKCAPEDPTIIIQDTWSFLNASATLSIPFPLLGEGTIPFIVKEITDSRMTFEIYFNDNHSSYRFNFRVAAVE